jgi:hypothetical protein
VAVPHLAIIGGDSQDSLFGELGSRTQASDRFRTYLVPCTKYFSLVNGSTSIGPRAMRNGLIESGNHARR